MNNSFFIIMDKVYREQRADGGDVSITNLTKLTRDEILDGFDSRADAVDYLQGLWETDNTYFTAKGYGVNAETLDYAISGGFTIRQRDKDGLLLPYHDLPTLVKKGFGNAVVKRFTQ